MASSVVLLVLPAGSTRSTTADSINGFAGDSSSRQLSRLTACGNGPAYEAWTTRVSKGAIGMVQGPLVAVPDVQNGGIVVASQTSSTTTRIVRKLASNDTEAADVVLLSASGTNLGGLSLMVDRGDIYFTFITTNSWLALRKY